MRFLRFWADFVACGILMIFSSAKCRSKIEIFAESCDLEPSGRVIWAGSAAEAGVLET